MLSDVMGNAPEGGIWVTIQVHRNVIGVALLRSFKAIIFACDRTPDPEVIEKSQEEGIALFSSADTEFAITGKLFQLGIRSE
jgi:hypothetical protein